MTELNALEPSGVCKKGSLKNCQRKRGGNLIKEAAEKVIARGQRGKRAGVEVRTFGI